MGRTKGSSEEREALIFCVTKPPENRGFDEKNATVAQRRQQRLRKPPLKDIGGSSPSRSSIFATVTQRRCTPLVRERLWVQLPPVAPSFEENRDGEVQFVQR